MTTSAQNDPDHIYTWRRLDAILTTSGQPSQEELVALQKLGVQHVVNLGLHDHERALADEGDSVARLGMSYTHIPVAFDNPTEEDFAVFCDTLSRIKGAPVHIHCIANMRVTAFLYRYQRDIIGREEAQARALMDTVWQPGGVWAKFIGDDKSEGLPHRPPIGD